MRYTSIVFLPVEPNEYLHVFFFSSFSAGFYALHVLFAIFVFFFVCVVFYLVYLMIVLALKKGENESHDDRIKCKVWKHIKKGN